MGIAENGKPISMETEAEETRWYCDECERFALVHYDEQDMLCRNCGNIIATFEHKEIPPVMTKQASEGEIEAAFAKWWERSEGHGYLQAFKAGIEWRSKGK